MVKNILVTVLASALGGGLAYFFHLIGQRREAHCACKQSLDEFNKAVDTKGWKEWDQATVKIYENLRLEVALDKKAGQVAILILVLTAGLLVVLYLIP